MTYKELKDQIKNINIAYGIELKVSKGGQSVHIGDANGCYAIITNKISYSLYIAGVSFESLEDNLRHDLLSVVYEFAQTPVNLRNLSPKYYISSKLTPDDEYGFLFKDNGDIDSLGWGRKNGGGTEFTQEEIDYICDKFHTDLNDFNIDEVK